MKRKAQKKIKRKHLRKHTVYACELNHQKWIQQYIHYEIYEIKKP